MAHLLERDISREIARIFKAREKNDKAVQREYLKLMRDTRNRITDEIRMSGGVDKQNLQGVLARVDDEISSLSTRSLRNLRTRGEGMWEGGREASDKMLAALGLNLVLSEPSESQLLALLLPVEESLIGVSVDSRAKVRVALQQAVLGELSQKKTIDRVTDILSFSAVRGEKIMRTEVGTIFNAANQGRMGQSRELVPNLRKRWHSAFSERTRRGHAAADGQLRDIDEPFDVLNERTGRTEKLMYPSDPSASAEMRINCLCLSVPEIVKTAGVRT